MSSANAGHSPPIVEAPQPRRTGVTAATGRPATGLYTTANRPADIAVNGAVIAAGQAFNPTANWDTWADVTLSVPLNAGANTIRITGATATGPANIDYIEIS